MAFGFRLLRDHDPGTRLEQVTSLFTALRVGPGRSRCTVPQQSDLKTDGNSHPENGHAGAPSLGSCSHFRMPRGRAHGCEQIK